MFFHLEKISIGETAVVLEGDIRNRETNLGNFAADGLLQWVRWRYYSVTVVTMWYRKLIGNPISIFSMKKRH